MKKTLFTSALLLAAAALPLSAQQLHTLDLTKASTTLEFDSETGAWTDNFTDAATTINSQVFSFVHGAINEMGCWWGFTASNSNHPTRRTDTFTYQYDNMAGGGLELDADGAVKLDENGNPVVNAAVPYLVAYYGPYFSKRPVDMTFADGKCYEPVGVYVNNTNYPYYVIEEGDGFCRPFHNGDKYQLHIIGVHPDGSETSVDVTLASYTNGDLTITRSWKYVDLTSLGIVNEIYFKMSTTDVGDWGDNTPEYFALDKLSVRDASQGSVSAPMTEGCISYNRASATVNIEGEQFAALFDAAGMIIMTTETGSMNLTSLPAGIYVVKAGNETLKIAR